MESNRDHAQIKWVVLFAFLYPPAKPHMIPKKSHNLKWLKSPVMKSGKYQEK